MLLTPQTSWRTQPAPRAALFIDMASYFDAAMEAMRRARHCVHLLNWAFEANTLFHPQPGGAGDDADRIGNFLIALAEKPGLDVRVLWPLEVTGDAASPRPSISSPSWTARRSPEPK